MIFTKHDTHTHTHIHTHKHTHHTTHMCTHAHTPHTHAHTHTPHHSTHVCTHLQACRASPTRLAPSYLSLMCSCWSAHHSTHTYTHTPQHTHVHTFAGVQGITNQACSLLSESDVQLLECTPQHTHIHTHTTAHTCAHIRRRAGHHQPGLLPPV